MELKYVINMKPKHFFFASGISAVLACLCISPARHYASTAYTLWLRENAASLLRSQAAARADHFWVGVMVGLLALAVLLLFAGLQARRQRMSPERAA